MCKVRIIAAIFAIIHLASTYVYSMNAMVDKVFAVSRPDNTQVSFEVTNAFTKDIDEGIKSGIPTTFTFFVEIKKKNSMWFNETAGAMTFRHTIKYDTLKEEYELILDEKPQEPVRIKDIEKAKKAMTSADIVLTHIPALKKGEQYQLRIKATLSVVNLPFPLNYMLFFISFWNYETTWYEYALTP